MMLDALQHIDQHLYLSMFDHGGPIVDRWMLFLSAKQTWLALLSFGLCWLWLKRMGGGLSFVITAACAVGGADWTAYRLLKPFFGRWRPCHSLSLDAGLGLDYVLTKCGGLYSFPSNHATNAAAMWMCLYLFSLSRRQSAQPLGRDTLSFHLVTLLLAFGVAYSRVYLGVHYPGDVLFGLAYGAVFAWVVWQLRCVLVEKALPFFSHLK